MSKELLTSALIDIAGKNVIRGENRDIANLCKCVNYLSIQLCIKSEELGESADNILKYAEEILNPKEATNGN